MEYRHTQPTEHGSITQRQQVQWTMDATGPHEILDTLVVFANICEARALTLLDTPLGPWYQNMSNVLRAAMVLGSQSGPKPEISFENPSLYFPDVETLN